MMLFLFYFVIFSTVSVSKGGGIITDILQDIENAISELPIVFGDCRNIHVSSAKLSYTLYTRKNQTVGINLTNSNLNEINPLDRVIFIIHGWLQGGNRPWVIKMKDTYLKKEAANIIVLDWSAYADAVYGISFCSVDAIGNYNGDFIYNMTQATGISASNVTLIGFSLGGQIAGYTGQKLRSKGHVLGTIHGLDIAGPGYLSASVNKRLDKGDANFVQAIHTSNNQFGYTAPYADVDFMMSYGGTCGVLQPGCPLDPGIPAGNSFTAQLMPILFCNHVRSVAYFIESINSDKFLGFPCSSCVKFNLGGCKNGAGTVMGENCPRNATGTKYLTTNCKWPYAKGKSGSSGSLLPLCPPF